MRGEDGYVNRTDDGNTINSVICSVRGSSCNRPQSRAAAAQFQASCRAPSRE